MKKRIFIWIIFVYLVLNMFNTFFLTTKALNQYIVPFNTTFSSFFFSFFADIAVLSILLLIGILIFRKEKRVAYYLIFLSLVLNIAIIAIQYYNKSYKIAFSIFNFSLLKSPTGGFGSNVFLDWVYELFLYFRIFNLLPFIVLLTLTIVFRKSFKTEKMVISWKKYACYFLALASFQITSYVYFQNSLEKNWNFSSEYAQYGCQHAGVYNYYISEIVFHIDNRNIGSKSENAQTAYEKLEPYNKNKAEYTNFIDHKTYSIQDRQSGILSGYNVFVIQMESMMSFAFEHTYNGIEVTPYFNKRFKDPNCFYFDNVHTNVGIGNTSDAEFTFFTGLVPTGDMTVVWEYDTYDFDLPNLGNHLQKNGYTSYSYNPTDEVFYNHKVVHEGLYQMNQFMGLDTYVKLYPKKEYPDNYLKYWIRDNYILKWAVENAKAASGPSFSFVETITPHNPFPDFSKEYSDYEIVDFDLGFENYQLQNYLSQVHYDDKLLNRFLDEATDPNSPLYMGEKTLFILYGDHGNALKKASYEKLLGKKLTDLEYRNLLLKIPMIFYDPSGEIRKTISEEDASSIFTSVRSLSDLYRTLTNLLGFRGNEKIFGVNMFSTEPSFTYDSKNNDVICDDFMYCKKNQDYSLFPPHYQIDLQLADQMVEYRRRNDLYLNTLIYQSPRRKNKS